MFQNLRISVQLLISQGFSPYSFTCFWRIFSVSYLLQKYQQIIKLPKRRQNMTNNTDRKYLSIRDIQNEYLPLSNKKIREFVKEHLYVKKIGNRIYVERTALEALLSSGKSQRCSLDWQVVAMTKEKIKVLLIEAMCHPKPYYVKPSMKAFIVMTIQKQKMSRTLLFCSSLINKKYFNL